MKVCLLNDSFPPVIDGVANVVLNYAKILQQEKLADVMVGTPRYPDIDYSTYPYKVVPYRSIDTTKIVKGYRAGNPLDIKELNDMVDFYPDIIHSHCPFASNILGRMLRAKVDVPLIFTYHTKFDVDIAKAVKAKFIQKETIKALVSNIDACDEVWVVSQGAGENLSSLGFEGNYRVMNNGVDFPKGRVDIQRVNEVTGSYDLPDDLPIFLFVGRIIKYKGLPLILDALAKLWKSSQDFRMVFVGSGPDEDELKQKSKELGISEKCIFTGPIYDREALRAWNTRSDLFLFPSTYDTNGIVVREAAACGLASVLINGSCAAEGITHNQNGFLIDNSSDSLFDLLKEISKNKHHMRDIGEHAMNEIYISWAESVHAANDRYLQIIDDKKCGKLASKQHLVADHILDVTTELAKEAHEKLKEQKHVIEGMRENFGDIKGDILEDIIRKDWK